MKMNYLHLIYEKGKRRNNSLRKFLLDEINHTIQSNSKSNKLIDAIPSKLSNDFFSSVIVYLDLDEFGFKSLHNLILKIVNNKNIRGIICFGSKKSGVLFDKLNEKLKKNLIYLADPLNSSTYRSVLFNLLEKKDSGSPQSVRSKGREAKESIFFNKLPSINIGVKSILYDVRNTINGIKVLGDQVSGSTAKEAFMQKGIYCYCDDFLALLSDIIGTPDSLFSQREYNFSVKSIFEYILEKYEKIFGVLDVVITCEENIDKEVYLDNYWLKRILSYLVTSCQRELVSKEVSNPSMHLSFEEKEGLYIFVLKTNDTSTSNKEIEELFSMFDFDEGKDRSGLGFLMLKEFLNSYQSKIDVLKGSSGLLFRVEIPNKSK